MEEEGKANVAEYREGMEAEEVVEIEELQNSQKNKGKIYENLQYRQARISW